MYLLDDLWYGNIRPVEQFTNHTSEYKRLMQKASDMMVCLQKTLTPEEYQMLEDYCTTNAMLGGLSEESAFIYGVRLGVRFILDAMDGISFPDGTR